MGVKLHQTMFDVLFKTVWIAIVYKLKTMQLSIRMSTYSIRQFILLFITMHNAMFSHKWTQYFFIILFAVFSLLMQKCDSKRSSLLPLCLHWLRFNSVFSQSFDTLHENTTASPSCTAPERSVSPQMASEPAAFPILFS